jgi:protein O-GlcNAc transferase
VSQIRSRLPSPEARGTTPRSLTHSTAFLTIVYGIPQAGTVTNRPFSAAPRPLQRHEAFRQALALHDQGRQLESENLYQMVLAADDRHFGALNGMGLLRLQQSKFEDAARLFRRAVKLDKNSAHAQFHLGVALTGLKRPEEAVRHYERAVALAPRLAEAHNNLGYALQLLGRDKQAIAHYERALAIRPDYAEARNNLGNVLHLLGRDEEAIAHYERALAIRPDYAEAHWNIGNALQALGREEDAVGRYESALAAKPDYADAHRRLADALCALKRDEEAIAHYDKALAIRPDHVDALVARGNALRKLDRYDEAMASFEKALSINPENPSAFNELARAADACDWARTAKISRELVARVDAGKLAISPFIFLGYCSDPALQLACARAFIRHKVPTLPPRLCKTPVRRHDKMRIAYVGTGFHNHPMAHLTTELFELHDRSRFEVLGVSIGPKDNSDFRARLIRALDQFHDVPSRGDRDIAMLLHDLEVDIAIDRSGYVVNARPGIFAYRPAPIQVNYLGYPGTLGADFYDYVIADPIVLPFDQQAFFTEKIVHLPECYQANDSTRAISAETPTRQEMELPERAFVFCCFNDTYKITASVFDIWMRLLKQIDGSVLWLFRKNAAVETNLRQEAAARGIDPARLVFAGRLKLEQHLARHRLADLFLDTLPYNAHTTGSDALWVGLPLLTCRGDSFAGRVAASLLVAVGLPELATDNFEEYEALALRLAKDPLLLRSFRQRLNQNRLTYPLFDTDRYRRHLEAAFTNMWELWQRGERPRSFTVERIANDTALTCPEE